MKKYAALSLLCALGACSMLEPMLAKDYTLPDITGENPPAALDNKTFLPSSEYIAGLRITNGYLSFKSSNPYDTFPAKILKTVSGASPYKFFITDGSQTNGGLRFIALCISNDGNGIYGIGRRDAANTNSFPPLYNSSDMGRQEDAIHLSWMRDASIDLTPIPAEYQGRYNSTSTYLDGGKLYYKITATGMLSGTEGGEHPYEDTYEDKFLRVKTSANGYELYLEYTAYKLVKSGASYELYKWSSSYSPGKDVTFDTTGRSPDYKK